ncbi:MAG: hypothetical protein RIT28_4777 [Pseudomonadota bacterium]
MLRAVLSTLLAVVLGSVLIGIVQSVGHGLFPLSGALDPNDPEAMAKIIGSAPLGALLMVELAYVVGCAFAGAVVVRLAPGFGLRLPVIVGALFTLAGFLNLAAIPHPLWFAVLTTVTYLPMSLLGAKALGEGAGAKNA